MRSWNVANCCDTEDTADLNARPLSRGHRPTCRCKNRLVGVLSIRTSSTLGSAAKRRHSANAPTALKSHAACMVSQSPLCVSWVFFFGFGLVPFLFWTTLFASLGSVGFPSVLCQKAQCRFRWRHPTWGGPSSFLLKLFFTHDTRTLPGFALPGVSTTLLFGGPLAVCNRTASYRTNR